MPGGSIHTGWTRWDSSWPSSPGPEVRRSLEEYFRDRFGVEARALSDFSFMKRGQTLYALSAPQTEPEPLACLRVVSVGLPFVRKVGRYLKPTSAALRLLAAWVTRNRLCLEPQQALELLRQGELALEHSFEEGYLLLESSGLALGCGLALPGWIKSQIPRREIRALFPKAPKAQRTPQGPLWIMNPESERPKNRKTAEPLHPGRQ